jgi:hypothetical protein
MLPEPRPHPSLVESTALVARRAEEEVGALPIPPVAGRAR